MKKLQKHKLLKMYLMGSQTTETTGRPAVGLVDKWLAMAREEYLPGTRFSCPENERNDGKEKVMRK